MPSQPVPLNFPNRQVFPSMRLMILCLVGWTCHCDHPCAAADLSERPNVVVIMVDDLGFSDLGCYGGEIETPNLDALASGGLRFSQFYNTAKCHSSRVSLLTGQYCIAAGDVALSHAVTSAEVLRDGGYTTAMTGKWHLKQQPTDFGFERYFGHLSGACNYFSGDNTFRLDGQPWKVPSDGFYTTVANVDYAIEFLDAARETDNPFYLYVAFNAPHAPLHALPKDYAKYKGRYDDGWDVIRARRVEKQKQLGLFQAESNPSPRPPHIPAWDSVEPWQQAYEANRMTTLAAMIDRVDQEIGRLVKDLQRNDELDNTLILFVSDNGACPYDRRAPLLDVEPTDANTALADSTPWSWVRNTPFRYYKQNQFEGGISTPAIIHWPAGIHSEPGSITHQTAHLIDVLPTLSEVTGCVIPNTHPDRDLRPVSGVSLAPLLNGKKIKREEPIHLLFSKDRGLRDGDWKLVSYKNQTWELYNIAVDRTELNNLAAEHPERLTRMIAKWKEMTHDVLHSPRIADQSVVPASFPHANREWTKFDGSTTPRAKANGRDRTSRAIRARKNTTMKLKPGSIELVFSGDDPGIAMDLRRHDLPAGPYRVEFDLTTAYRGVGEIYFTEDKKTILPKGTRIEWDISQQSRSYSIPIETGKTLGQLRIDTCDGKGTAVLAQLRLIGPNDEVLIDWMPTQRKQTND